MLARGQLQAVAQCVLALEEHHGFEACELAQPDLTTAGWRSAISNATALMPS